MCVSRVYDTYMHVCVMHLCRVRWGGWLVPVAMVALMALTLLACVLRKQRRLEGSYQPSHEEKKQARHQQQQGAERPGLALPLPKEERLI